MTDKQLRRLSRADLLEMLLEQTKELEQTQKKYQQALKQLENRRLVMEETGSIAEASLQLNQVFESAQQAAEQYLYNIRQMEAETRERCAVMVKKAEEDSAAYWHVVYSHLQELGKDRPELREYLSSVLPPEYM